MAVRKTKKGLALKRWFKEKWTDEKGNPCGSRKNKNTKKCRPSRRVSSKTVKTWGEMSPSEKRRAVAEKKRVGMGRKTSQIRRKTTKAKNTNKGDAPNYGTMNNKKDGGGTNYFSMNYMDNKNNAQDANTPSVFKDPDGVAMAGGTYGLNSGHEDITPAQHGEHTEEKDGHSHGGFINKAKNYLINSAANLEVRYGSSGQQGGLSTRRPDHGFRIFGPKDSEIKNKG